MLLIMLIADFLLVFLYTQLLFVLFLMWLTNMLHRLVIVFVFLLL